MTHTLIDMTHTLIEKPLPAHSTTELRAYLKQLEELPQDDPGVQVAIGEVKRSLQVNEALERGEEIKGPPSSD